MNSTCYRKSNHPYPWTWYSASNECLSRGGSLAVFSDIADPEDNSQLTDWLNSTEVYRGEPVFYYIGLMRSWWNTTDERKFTSHG